MSWLEDFRNMVRKLMTTAASGLNNLSGGKITPNMITLASLVMHLPIAYLIARGYLGYAAGLLMIFGLFDALDGALARVQGSSSASGMFLDSITDRIKEVVIYIGISGYLVLVEDSFALQFAVAALGASLVTSYVNAWGEVALTSSNKKSAHQTNKGFRVGFGSFDVRIVIIIIGLLFSRLDVALLVILVLAIHTILIRIMNTIRALK